MSKSPTIHSVKKINGIAGQFCYDAVVQYPDEPQHTIRFVGNVYGGPVVMITPAGQQHFINEPVRFGEFGKSWVRRFFA